MKKTLLIFILVVYLFVFSACGNSNTNPTNSSNNSEITIINDDKNNSNQTNVFASYSDSASNFIELESTASYIIRGYVLSTKQKSEVAQEAIIKVTDTYKGKTSTEITMYQMLNDNNVKTGNEYILFLNPQEPDKPDSQIYYPVGGGIGALKIDESAKEILTADSRIIDSDMESWVNNNLASTRSSDEYKILVNPD